MLLALIYFVLPRLVGLAGSSSSSQFPTPHGSPFGLSPAVSASPNPT